MSSAVEFFYDYGSPYSYIANSRLAGLIDRTGCTIHYRPMLLGGVFKATGNHSPAEEKVEAKRLYLGAEMKRWVEHLQVNLRSNPHFPVNTLLLMRCAHAAMARGEFEAFHAAAFSGLWEQEKNLADPHVLDEVLSGVGIDAGSLVADASDTSIKAALRETTEEAVARGVFGAPSFFVDGELFFGNDRLDFVERALA